MWGAIFGVFWGKGGKEGLGEREGLRFEVGHSVRWLFCQTGSYPKFGGPKGT